ncbi:MAG TPA: tripartite tricarboxylate transporter substrate-binding protein [Alphaproteobacteria bacterium]|jgi:tripartite-type tricarboxylate transporter receptor subunit TctC
MAASFKTNACIGLLALSAALPAAPPAKADAAADFYKSKPELTILISSAPGGSYDVYGRMITRYMSKHMPGNPTIISNNMPGAGGMRAANYLYTVAPKDGSVISIMDRGIVTAPLLYGEESKAQFDATKFNWIGSAVIEMGMGAVSLKSPATSLDEMRTREVVFGASGPETDPAMYARLFNKLYGTKIKVIAGYPGQTETLLAVEKGEIDGLFLSGWSGAGRAYVKDKVKKGEWKVFVQMTSRKDPEHDEAPSVFDVLPGEKNQQILTLLFDRQILGRPFVAPPGVPADRVALLRDAFRKSLSDKDLLAEAEKQKYAISPVFGEEAQEIVQRIYTTSGETVENTRALLKAAQ